MRIEESIIVVADTHFGLRDEIFFEPEVFSGFLRWVKRLEKGEVKPLKLGDWNGEKNEKVLKPPDRIILLGDILELWDASDRSIDVCIRSFTQLFSKLDCEKIYVLGNHDDILEEIAPNRKHYYPLGASGLRIVKEIYPDQSVSVGGIEKVKTIKVGNEEYLFIHGQQFRKGAVIGRLYNIIAYMREAAMAFGYFTWIFVFLFIIGIVFMLLRWFSPSSWMLILLGLLAVPRIFISIARPGFDAIQSTRYERVNLTIFRKWWEKFSRGRGYPLKNLNIVYGHTHLVDVIFAKSPDVRLLNIPAWVKDLRSRKKREDVLRAAFLYIDDDGGKFIGWDWDKSMPFFIPKKVIATRREGRALTDEDQEKLRTIGWPNELLREWGKALPIKDLKRTRKEALFQELKHNLSRTRMHA